MRAGALRHRIKFMRPVDSTNDYGAVEQRQQLFTQRNAHIQQLDSKEVYKDAGTVTDYLYKVTVRSDKQTRRIDQTFRIVWGCQEFEIITPPIDKHQRNMDITFMCRRVSP